MTGAELSARTRTAASPWAGRSAVVMGLGSFGGGLGAARWLLAQGARVTVTDLRDASRLGDGLAALEDHGGADLRLALGGHAREDFEGADLVVANPAVPPGHPLLAAARAAGARVALEIELLLEHLPAPALAVTGTHGKSSTCRMLADLLAAGGRRVHLGGNIGGSLLGELAAMRPDDLVVLELSSYQLECLPPRADARGEGTRPAAAVAITNLAADHLERHGTLAAYHAAKLRLLELAREGGAAFLPAHLAGGDAARAAAARGVRVVATGASGADGLRLEDGVFLLGERELGRAADLPLHGRFQEENALLALGLAHLAGVPAGRLGPALAGVTVPEHRLQDLGLAGGRRIWDNGVATTPESTLAALRSVEGPCVLLCGGRAKRDLAWDDLAAEAFRRGAAVVCFGESGPEVARALGAGGVRTRTVPALAEAVDAAFEEARGGEAILFSPGCASFDAWSNFRERALAFRAAVEARR